MKSIDEQVGHMECELEAWRERNNQPQLSADEVECFDEARQEWIDDFIERWEFLKHKEREEDDITAQAAINFYGLFGKFKNQRHLYEEMMKIQLTDDLDHGTCDYVKVDSINGIDYYTPNDEDWGSIVAICNENRLAHDTTFFEMDDMENIGAGYTQIVHEGAIKCEFEAES